MSGGFVTASLPPSDRDDAPVPPAREPVDTPAAAVPPGADLVLDGADRALEELVVSFAELARTRNHAALPAIEALAHRHATLAGAFAGTITAARQRRGDTRSSTTRGEAP